MSLQTFCLLSLGVAVLLLVAGAVIEGEIEYRRRQIKRVRDLKAENRDLRAALRRTTFETGWELDTVKTELAVKELLLRQKWAEAKK